MEIIFREKKLAAGELAMILNISEIPRIIRALQFIENEHIEHKELRKPKGYNLTKVANKALGYVYYVRYWHEGRMVPSKWTTATNDYAEASDFAIKNRERLITEYYRKRGNDVERFFETYYDPESAIYKGEVMRSGEVTEKRNEQSLRFMQNTFVPFLRSRKIIRFEDITVPLLDDFQDAMLQKGIKPQTINGYMSFVKKAFKYLMRKGMVSSNPCAELQALPIKPGDKSTHGCHEIGKIKGVFSRSWDDELSRLLNLLIYTTDMRNCEIRRFCKDDIVVHHGVHFINLKQSKTVNGVRYVPLHPAVYDWLMSYAAGISGSQKIFGKTTTYAFDKAATELGRRLGVSVEEMKAGNITFYSGRHFWKTLMSSEELGAGIEEVFMGHKVTSDVSKLYNHHEAAGKERLARKAKDVFAILDRRLF